MEKKIIKELTGNKNQTCTEVAIGIINNILMTGEVDNNYIDFRELTKEIRLFLHK